MPKALEKVVVGDRFGKLIVLGEGKPTKWYKTVRCCCDCGREKDIKQAAQ